MSQESMIERAESADATGQSIADEEDTEEEKKELFQMSILNSSTDRLLEQVSSYGNADSSVSAL
jgi:hypothetical protein